LGTHDGSRATCRPWEHSNVQPVPWMSSTRHLQKDIFDALQGRSIRADSVSLPSAPALSFGRRCGALCAMAGALIDQTARDGNDRGASACQLWTLSAWNMYAHAWSQDTLHVVSIQLHQQEHFEGRPTTTAQDAVSWPARKMQGSCTWRGTATGKQRRARAVWCPPRSRLRQAEGASQ
jgi:hypothetical protein